MNDLLKFETRDSNVLLETFPASRSDVVKVAVGFSPRIHAEQIPRRVATAGGISLIERRYATQQSADSFRGLKPTATISPSLRDSLNTRTQRSTLR